MRSTSVVRRALFPVVLAAAATPAFGQTWVSPENGNFGDPTNWLSGQVPVSSPGTVLTFTNPGRSSYRAFNDLGELRVGGINLDSRTNTATFIGQTSGSSLRFVDSAFVNGVGDGLFRFGGVSGVVNDWHLEGALRYTGTGYGSVFAASPVANAAGSVGSIVVDHASNNELEPSLRLEGINTFSGGVTLLRGNLEVGNAAALGSGVLRAQGGTIRTTSSLTVANAVEVTGTLHLRPTVAGTFSGPISGVGGVDLRAVGATASAVTLTGANTYTGTTVIASPDFTALASSGTGLRAGRLIVAGAAGSVAGSTSYSVRDGGILELDYAQGVVDRLNPTAPVTLSAGRLSLLGNNTAGALTVQRAGAVTVEGQSEIFLNGRNGGVRLDAASFTRAGRGTVVLTQGGNAGGTLWSGVAPTLVNGIVPWMGQVSSLITSPRNLVTYEAGVFRGLRADEYATDLSGGSTSNVRLLTSFENTGTVDVNALVVGDGSSATAGVNVTGGGIVRVGSGAFMLLSNAAFDNDVDFGTAEGILQVGVIGTVGGVFRGSNGITKSGDFSLTTTATHAYTGLTTINAGGFRFSQPDAFASSSGFVNHTAGGGELTPSLNYNGVGTATLSQPAQVSGGAFRLTSEGDARLVYAGTISGPGLVVLEDGAAWLTADNTYTGGTRISRAEVEVDRDANFGDAGGTLEIAGTTGRGLVVTGDWTSSRVVRLTRVGTLDANGNAVVWNGPVEGTSGLTVVGQGVLRLIGDSPNTGTWNVGTFAGAPGRVEVDGDTRFTASIYGVFAARGRAGRLTTFNDGVLAPGDVDGAGVGSIEAIRIALGRGTSVLFDLGAQSDYLSSVTDFARVGTGDAPVTLDFRIGAGLQEATYVLVEYDQQPSAAQTFDVSDLAFTSDVDGFDGFFSFVEGSRFALTFTVTAVPEPGSAGLAGGAAVLLLRRRRI